MLGFLPPFLRGLLSFLVLAANTLFWCLLLFVLALIKAVIPGSAVLTRLDVVINHTASAWVACNSAWMHAAYPMDWRVEGAESLRYNDWYLVNCNHQSWVDIFVLQHALNWRIPVLKFFLKAELIYVPVIGLAWWALDFPFMQRHSRQALRKNPQLRNEDLVRARKACAKFAKVPTSVMNFVEGTRFTPEKHATQASPYQLLLKPKAGAMAMALNAMGTQFHSLVDASIAYPDGIPTFWQFLCGQVPRTRLHVRQLEIPREFCTGDYENDRALRKSFHLWLDHIWQQKDQTLATLLKQAQTH
ncbi:MAG: acyltransferase [Rhodoferax sp.]|nr:acyltransferase [Rhodoferax sp.]